MSKLISHGSRKCLITGCVGLAVACLLLAGRTARAVEPAQDFLEGLRERGFFDTAIEYLDKVKDSPLVTPSFKRVVAYEKGITMLMGAKFINDTNERVKQLDAAKAALEEFTNTQKTHTYYWSGKNQLANLMVERARMNLQQADKKTTPDDEKKTLRDEARAQYAEAKTTFESTRGELKTRLESIRKDLNPDNPADKPLIKIRDRYRTDYLQARLVMPAVMEELADTYPDDEAKQKELLLAAAKEYDQVYEDYRTRIAGLYARMYQGRCYMKMKDYKEALSYFDDLLANPNEPEPFRVLKRKVLTMAVDIWLAPDQNKYLVAIDKLEDILKVVNPFEAKQEEWVFLRLNLAKAYLAFAQDLEKKPNKTAEDRRQMTINYNQARKLATAISRIEKSEYKRPAQELLAAIRGGDLPDEVKEEPKTFAEARLAGKETLDEVQTALFVAKQLREDLAKATDEQEKADIQKQLSEQNKVIQAGPAKAMDYFRLAVALADAETPTTDINLVRYFLSYLYFTQSDFYRAALLGEFICRRYPDAAGARQSAKIAMASYLQIRKEQLAAAAEKGETPETNFADQKMVEIADYILKKWEGEAEAIEAANTLIVMMIKQQKLDKAQEYLETIPVDNPERGKTELSIGGALWSSYLRGMARMRKWKKDPETLPAGITISAEEARLDPIKKKAEEILTAGVERMKQGEVTPVLVTAVLNLAQIYVDIGQTDKALQLLEDKNFGPYSLVKQNHPTTQRENFETETCKVALRANIANLKSGDQQTKQAAKDKAKEVMARLKAAMGEARKDELVGIYIRVAADLKTQMEAIESQSEKEAFAEALAGFLDDVRQGAADLEVLIWVANTFAEMGELFEVGGQATTKSRPYYEKAAAAFEEILKSPSLTDPKQQLQVRMKVAAANRSLGPFDPPNGKQVRFNKAMDMFKSILMDNSMILVVQMEAAKTYQQWGAHLAKATGKVRQGAATLYVRAIQGGHKDERAEINGDPNPNLNKNIIWGFGRMGQITIRGIGQARAQLKNIDVSLNEQELADIDRRIDETKKNNKLSDSERQLYLDTLFMQKRQKLLDLAKMDPKTNQHMVQVLQNVVNNADESWALNAEERLQTIVALDARIAVAGAEISKLRDERATRIPLSKEELDKLNKQLAALDAKMNKELAAIGPKIAAARKSNQDAAAKQRTIDSLELERRLAELNNQLNKALAEFNVKIAKATGDAATKLNTQKALITEVNKLQTVIAKTQRNAPLEEEEKKEAMAALTKQIELASDRAADLESRKDEINKEIAELKKRIEGLMAVFLESRYYLAECRLEYARLKKSKKYVDMTIKDIDQTATASRNYEGHPSWKSKFESLKTKAKSTRI